MILRRSPELDPVEARRGLFVRRIRTKGWDREFSEPILLPKGKKLTNLRYAAPFITKLPKVEHDAEEWQAAMEALPLVAEHAGPTMFARIGVMRALHRHGRKCPLPRAGRLCCQRC